MSGRTGNEAMWLGPKAMKYCRAGF